MLPTLHELTMIDFLYEFQIVNYSVKFKKKTNRKFYGNNIYLL